VLAFLSRPVVGVGVDVLLLVAGILLRERPGRRVALEPDPVLSEFVPRGVLDIPADVRRGVGRHVEFVVTRGLGDLAARGAVVDHLHVDAAVVLAACRMAGERQGGQRARARQAKQ
jgi:hypothetical protein